MYLSRGNPVIYYGDEQGFTGDGGDQDARQDMFPSQVASYNDDDLIGTDATTADDNFDADHPLYQSIGELARRDQQPPGAARRRPAAPALLRPARASTPSRGSTGTSSTSTWWRSTTPSRPQTAAVPTYRPGMCVPAALRHRARPAACRAPTSGWA